MTSRLTLPQPASAPAGTGLGKRVTIDAPRLWGGGVATAVVAALAAAVGVLVCRDLLQVKLVEPPLLTVTKSFAANYAITAFVLALAATGLAHLLSVATPRPRVFFGWIVAPRDGRDDGGAVRLGGHARGQDLRRSDQYGDRSVHRQSAVRRTVSHRCRCRTIVAAALGDR